MPSYDDQILSASLLLVRLILSAILVNILLCRSVRALYTVCLILVLLCSSVQPLSMYAVRGSPYESSTWLRLSRISVILWFNPSQSHISFALTYQRPLRSSIPLLLCYISRLFALAFCGPLVRESAFSLFQILLA